MKTLSVLTIGITAIILQVTALRELLSVFTGNELDIGITLSAWLVTVAAGSYAGRRITHKNAFPLSFIAIALASQLSIILIQLIRPALSLELGETAPLPATLFSTVVTLLPLCLTIGAQFPLAVSYLDGKAAKAYGLEAGGAFAGGVLFTFFISGHMDASAVAAAIGFLNIVIAAVLMRKRLLIIALVAPLFMFFYSEHTAKTLKWKGGELTLKAQSRYGEIEVLRIREQFNVYSSGKFQFSYPDAQSEEMKAHMPMLFHPAPARLLVVGGSPAVLRELLKYPVSAIDFVEIDPEMARVSIGLLGGRDRELPDDKRLTLLTADARKYIKSLKEKTYDLIILNLPEPSTANINRLYTVEFFREARNAMRPGGVLILSLPTSYGYVGKRMQMANGSIYNSLTKVFPSVEASSEEYGIVAASNRKIDVDPAVLRKRFTDGRIATRFFHPFILNDAFSPLKVNKLKTRLEQVKILNTDMRPAAYLLNMMVWAEMQDEGMLMSVINHGGSIIIGAGAAGAAVAALLRRKRRAVEFSVFITGYSAMAFSLIIILSYQAAFGYVFVMLGLLTALFMAGVAAGAYGIRPAARPLSQIRATEGVTIILFAAAPLFFRHEALYYALNALIGVGAGREFAAANRFLQGSGSTNVAGRLYAFDLAGSFFGALLTALLITPLFGVQTAVLFVMALKAISLILLFTVRNEND